VWEFDSQFDSLVKSEVWFKYKINLYYMIIFRNINEQLQFKLNYIIIYLTRLYTFSKIIYLSVFIMWNIFFINKL